jgi:hypothetical protein
MPRKPQAPQPSIVLPSSPEAAVIVLAAGILAGPYGKKVMETAGPEVLDGVAEAAIDMYAAVQRGLAARSAA